MEPRGGTAKESPWNKAMPGGRRDINHLELGTFHSGNRRHIILLLVTARWPRLGDRPPVVG
jgi:hypothetical protein